MQEKIYIIGLMSGTSKDGLDIAYVSFVNNDGSYSFELHHAATISYPIEILNSLNEIEIKEYFEEITQELLEDYIVQRLNRQQEEAPIEDNDDE